MSKEMSLRRWQEEYAKGTFDAPDVSTQCKAGWYDWFCRDSSLANKTKKLAKPIMKLKDSAKINLDKMYVWFKNNCASAMYDDFRIADIETGDVLYTVTHKDPNVEGNPLWTVYAIVEGMVEEDNGNWAWKSYQFKTTKALVEWFNERR